VAPNRRGRPAPVAVNHAEQARKLRIKESVQICGERSNQRGKAQRQLSIALYTLKSRYEEGVPLSNGKVTPLKCPPGYDLDMARTCSFVVNVACDMCEQWKADGMPGPESKPEFRIP
jgi:hypothetical protein